MLPLKVVESRNLALVCWPFLRDRVCMSAAVLVLDPIFEADLPPEQYAYRPGRNAQQAMVEVEETLFRGHPGEWRVFLI